MEFGEESLQANTFHLMKKLVLLSYVLQNYKLTVFESLHGLRKDAIISDSSFLSNFKFIKPYQMWSGFSTKK